MDDFNFGENLRDIRLQKGISQEAMATLLKVSQATYSRLEKQASVPDSAQVKRLSKILGVPESHLLQPSILTPTSSLQKPIHKDKSLLHSHLGSLLAFAVASLIFQAVYNFSRGFLSEYQVDEYKANMLSLIPGISVLIYCYYAFRNYRRRDLKRLKDGQ